MSEEKKGQIVRFTRYEELPAPGEGEPELAWGHPVPIKDAGLDFFGESREAWKQMQDTLSAAMHASFEHWIHRKECTVDHPLCYRGSWAMRLNCWVLELQEWVLAYQDSVRPRCAETRDGLVSVIHHVEPCTCHEKCEGDEDEW